MVEGPFPQNHMILNTGGRCGAPIEISREVACIQASHTNCLGVDKSSSDKARAKALVKAILEVGPVRVLIDLGKPIPLYRSFLNHCLPSWIKFRGVYFSFDEARANAPRGARLGYDHQEIAGIHRGYSSAVHSSDYPVLYWLRDALEDGSRIFDFGGNLGVSFYAWQKYLRYNRNIEWLVCDLPFVVLEGQKLAQEEKECRLRFTSRFEDADGFDLLLMSGCLQCIEAPVVEFLHQLNRLPPHLVINRIPLHDSKECVTLLNIRSMVTPYHVFRRDRLIAEVESVGYKLIDIWSNADHSCWIPLYPEYSVAAYTGLYFRRE